MGTRSLAPFALLLFALLFPARDSAAEGGGKIGLGLASNDGKIEVVLVAPNSPAAKAGVAVGMGVEEIDGVKTAGKSLPECAAMVRGEVGKPVILKLTKPEDGTPLTVVLKRE